jgi:hypothetical protein
MGIKTTPNSAVKPSRRAKTKRHYYNPNHDAELSFISAKEHQPWVYSDPYCTVFDKGIENKFKCFDKFYSGIKRRRDYELERLMTNAKKNSVIADAKASILSALNSDKYDARTLDGIVRETKLSAPLVEKLLADDRDLRSQVKIYQRPNKDGQLLITTKDRFAKRASLTDKFVDFFASERKTLDDVFSRSK